MRFDLIMDPGHGWLKVPRKLLIDMGIESRITPYSYQRGDSVYLEEDQDASLFLTEARDRGYEIKFRERVSRERSSKVRGYDRFVSLTRGMR